MQAVDDALNAFEARPVGDYSTEELLEILQSFPAMRATCDAATALLTSALQRRSARVLDSTDLHLGGGDRPEAN
jgi:hypothetical protein